MTAIPEQAAIDFKPIGMTFPETPTRNRIVRAGCEVRYDQALEYLRLELKNGPTNILATDVSSTFKITGTFLFLLTHMGAITDLGIVKGKTGRLYQSNDRLNTVTGIEVRKHRKKHFPNPLTMAEIKQQIHGTVPVTVTVPFNLDGTGKGRGKSQPDVTVNDQDEVFLAGLLDGDKISLSTLYRTNDLEASRQQLKEFNVTVGQKMVIVQIIEVVESTVTLRPTTL